MKKNFLLMLITIIVFCMVGCSKEESNIVKSVKLVQFGNYGGEKIIWRILEDDGTKMLLLSENAIEVGKYIGTENSGNTWWINSGIRNFLNGGFYKNAFSSKERKDIKPVQRECYNITYHYADMRLTPWSNPDMQLVADRKKDYYYDKIFLLDDREMRKYFADKENRTCKPSNFVKGKYRIINPKNGTVKYWIRDTGGYIDFDGVIHIEENSSLQSVYAIRPAIWVDCTAVLSKK